MSKRLSKQKKCLKNTSNRLELVIGRIDFKSVKKFLIGLNIHIKRRKWMRTTGQMTVRT